MDRKILTNQQLKLIGSVIDFRLFPARLENMFDGQPRPQGYPDWVWDAAFKYVEAQFPRLMELNHHLERRKAYGKGLVFGMVKGGVKKVEADLEPYELAEDIEIDPQQGQMAWESLLGESAQYFSMPTDGTMIPPEWAKLERDVQSGFNLYEQADFDDGVADSVRMFAGDNHATETTKVIELMIICWRLVEAMPTSTILFNFLFKVLGAGLVGSDPKRIQQICRRLGKKFKKPGRPRKTTST